MQANVSREEFTMEMNLLQVSLIYTPTLSQTAAVFIGNSSGAESAR